MRRSALVLSALLLSCQAEGPAPAAAASAPRAEPAVSVATAASAPARRPKPKPKRASRPALRRLGVDLEGRAVAELGDSGRKVRVILATKQAPLAPLAPAAHHGIAAIVAPGIVAKTTLLAVPLSELAAAAVDARGRSLLEQLRVLSDGTVTLAVIEPPAATGASVDLGDVRDGSRAWSWESKLVTRDGPPAELHRVLASYQALLAVDHLVANLGRREVLHDTARERLVAIEDNAVFSPLGVDGAVGEASNRLHRHLVFSRSLVERLAKLDRAAAERALRQGLDRSLLVTPKQLEELLDRKRSLETLIETRIRQRGRERALALP